MPKRVMMVQPISVLHVLQATLKKGIIIGKKGALLETTRVLKSV